MPRLTMDLPWRCSVGGARQHLEGGLGAQALAGCRRAAAWHFPLSGASLRGPGARPLVQRRLAVTNSRSVQGRKGQRGPRDPPGVRSGGFSMPCCGYGSSPAIRRAAKQGEASMNSSTSASWEPSWLWFRRLARATGSRAGRRARAVAAAVRRAWAARSEITKLLAAIPAPAQTPDRGHAAAATPQPQRGRDAVLRPRERHTLGIDKFVDPEALQRFLTPEQRELVEAFGVDLSKSRHRQDHAPPRRRPVAVDLRQFKHQCRQSQGEIGRFATNELRRLENEMIRCDDRI